jgi:hypothetical protein
MVHVGAFGGFGEGEGQAAEIFCGHGHTFLGLIAIMTAQEIPFRNGVDTSY